MVLEMTKNFLSLSHLQQKFSVEEIIGGAESFSWNTASLPENSFKELTNNRFSERTRGHITKRKIFRVWEIRCPRERSFPIKDAVFQLSVFPLHYLLRGPTMCGKRKKRTGEEVLFEWLWGRAPDEKIEKPIEVIVLLGFFFLFLYQ